MVGISVDRELGSEQFEYGQHEIRIEVLLKYTNVWSHEDVLNYHLSLSSSPEGHYVRIVKVSAWKERSLEFKNETKVVLDEEREVSKLFGGSEVKNKVPNVRDHIGDTVRPVFEKLDELYQFTNEEASVDIDVATHEVKAETSWVEVEDEIDRLSREIDELAESEDSA